MLKVHDELGQTGPGRDRPTVTEPDEETGLPRLLIPLTIHFAVRYVVRTGLLDRLRSVCVPVLALSWDDPELVTELSGPGVEVVRLPDAEVSAEVRGLLNALEVPFTRRLGSPSTRIDQRRKFVDRPTDVRLKKWLAWERTQLEAMVPGAEERTKARLAVALSSGTNLAENEAFLDEHRIEALFSVTPFAIQELVVLHAVQRRAIPAITSILSFDNITTRPPLPITFDRYLVWNAYNADEIRRGYPWVPRDTIDVVGPGQFDFYADPQYVQERATWLARVGVSPEVPTVLYGAGPPSVSPHEDQYVDDLIAAIRRGALPRDLKIVLRRHPNDHPDRWERFRADPAVAFDDPGALGAEHYRPGQVNMARGQIVDLCSALAHTDVHVSVSSTMTLDGAFFDKPQIAPAYDVDEPAPFRTMAYDLYRREHFVPIVASGALELPRSPAELVAAVRRALDDPGRLEPQRRALLEELCTFTDGRCTERVADAVRAFLGRSVRVG